MERKIIKYLLFPVLIFVTPVYYLIFNILKYFRTKTQKKFNSLKIICIGNPDLGGSGKTTLVKKIVSDLKKLNKKVAIITRGYKRKSKTDYELLFPTKEYDTSYVFNVGDEAYMLFSELKVPIVVSKNRTKAMKLLKQEVDVDIIISDDGYQNFSFYKDINILVINLFKFAKKSFLFPLGDLREPIKDAVKRADYVVLNHINIVSYKTVEKFKYKIKSWNKDIKMITSYYKIESFMNLYTQKTYTLDEFVSVYNKIILCCGIGQPKIFKKMLELKGLNIIQENFYSDHYWYKPKDIIKWNSLGLPIVVTQKDTVKIQNFFDKLEEKYFDNIYYPKINFEIEEGNDLWQEMINSL